MSLLLRTSGPSEFPAPRGSPGGTRPYVNRIECKWSPDAFETRGLAAFRDNYPVGANYVVSPLNGPGYERTIDGLRVRIVSPAELPLRGRPSASP